MAVGWEQTLAARALVLPDAPAAFAFLEKTDAVSSAGDLTAQQSLNTDARGGEKIQGHHTESPPP